MSEISDQENKSLRAFSRYHLETSGATGFASRDWRFSLDRIFCCNCRKWQGSGLGETGDHTPIEVVVGGTSPGGSVTETVVQRTANGIVHVSSSTSKNHTKYH